MSSVHSKFDIGTCLPGLGKLIRSALSNAVSAQGMSDFIVTTPLVPYTLALVFAFLNDRWVVPQTDDH